MRVLRIVTRLNRGGPLRQLQALVPGLARRGVEGPVLVGDVEPDEEDVARELAAAGVRVERVPGLARGISPRRDVKVLQWLRARIRAERPDVVHTHLSKAGALGRLAARFERVPVVVHTFHGHHLAAPFPTGPAVRLAERGLAGMTTAAICLSPSQRRDLVERWRVVAPHQARVIGPGLDLVRFRASVDPARVAEIRARHTVPGKPLFLWLGRFVDVKDPRAAVLAAAGAWATAGKAPAYRLAMVGDGPLRPHVASWVAGCAAREVVTVPGPAADPWNWVAAADALVMSSRSEGTPLSLVEAMSLGVPVAATAVGGVPDIVRDGETGLLVAPGDWGALGAAINRLATDEALRVRLGRRAREEAESRFGADRLATETLALYAWCLATASGARGNGAPALRRRPQSWDATAVPGSDPADSA